MYAQPHIYSLTGKVAEWSKAHGLGFFICLRVSKEARVRTPPLPYFFLQIFIENSPFLEIKLIY